MGEPKCSDEYEAASAAHRVASKAYATAQIRYRAREIGDAEFLKARAAFAVADRAFDEAFAAEQAREPEPEVEPEDDRQADFNFGS